MVSERIQAAIKKVIEGDWTYFDFISNFDDVNTREKINAFYCELNIAFEVEERFHNFNPFYNDEGELVHIETDNSNPLYFDNLEEIRNYYKKLYDANFGNVGHNLPEAIDLSDIKAIDKILFFYKLGIIDFLRGQQPFTSVPDKVSQIISAITGINIDSVRPMVRPLINNDLDDNKNPLNSKNAVNRVEKHLINIGFNPNETN